MPGLDAGEQPSVSSTLLAASSSVASGEFLNEFLEPRHDIRMLRGHVRQFGYLGVEVIEAPASMRHRHGSALAQVGALLGAGQATRRSSMSIPEVKDDAFVLCLSQEGQKFGSRYAAWSEPLLRHLRPRPS